MLDSYASEQLNPHLWRITDSLGVCCYLVTGAERACLLDTCNGFGNIRSCAEALTNKPVFVILTHGHLDHAGGAGLFPEVWMNPADLPVFRKHSDMGFRCRDLSISTGRTVCSRDLVPEFTGRLQPLTDRQRFDLGGLTIEMIAVPGHTPGMMCVLLKEDRTILFGDACGVAVMLFDEFSSCVSAYRKSLLNLQKYEPRYDTVYRNHGTFVSPKILLENVIACCDRILAGSDDHIPVEFHGMHLYACSAADSHGRRLDGVEGNILYTAEKAR